mgnify:CR=1 FL=1
MSRLHLFLSLLWWACITSPEPNIPKPYRMSRLTPWACWTISGSILSPPSDTKNAPGTDKGDAP